MPDDLNVAIILIGPEPRRRLVNHGFAGHVFCGGNRLILRIGPVFQPHPAVVTPAPLFGDVAGCINAVDGGRPRCIDLDAVRGLQSELVGEIHGRLDADAYKDHVGRNDRSVVQFDSLGSCLPDGDAAHDLHALGTVKFLRIPAEGRRASLGQYRCGFLQHDNVAPACNRCGGDLEADDAASNESDVLARLQRTPQRQRIVHAAEIADRQRAALKFGKSARTRTCRQQQLVERKGLSVFQPDLASLDIGRDDAGRCRQGHVKFDPVVVSADKCRLGLAVDQDRLR